MTSTNNNSATIRPRRFDFARDSFAFANELLWEYQSDTITGKTIFRKREPKPDYAHRCFVLVRAARQFLYHARFAGDQKTVGAEAYRNLIRQVVARDPRKPPKSTAQIVIPGFASLREFSTGREQLLKAGCGGAWQSYVLRSHWRMVFPISRPHQALTAENLAAALVQGLSPIVHLVTFPRLTMNHGMILFEVTTAAEKLVFSCYDPNDPRCPAQLTFDRRSQSFFLPANSYWAGGKLNVIEIFRSWLM